MKAFATVAALTAALVVSMPAEAQTVAMRTKRIVATGLTLPTFVTHAPGDTNRLFILEKGGRIRVYDLTTNTLLTTPFMTITVAGGTSTSDERGLLGLAFDPDYATNGQFYVYYTGSSTNVLARGTVSANPNVANAGLTTMMSWSDPFTNHNGGWLGFGPDGNLYMATGDGGSGNDPNGAGQSLTTQLGKMHRIKPTVGGAAPYYTIPSGNPYATSSTTVQRTFWAYGLRNPWRCSFDRQTGDLWIGDVGQNAQEEINFQPASAAGGRNYGWRCTEGTLNTGLSGCTFGSPSLTAPVHTYPRTDGFSLTGGYVYRGCRLPALQGTYLFADYGSGKYWSFRYENGVKTAFTDRTSQLTPSIEGATVNQIASFGEDANGELYIVDHGGQVFKIIPTEGDGPCVPPPAPGDFNDDGVVNGADLGILLSNWGACQGCPSDMNGDGAVDGLDLGVLLALWTV
jgi:glucose/arabinose dehydrogenase